MKGLKVSFRARNHKIFSSVERVFGVVAFRNAFLSSCFSRRPIDRWRRFNEWQFEWPKFVKGKIAEFAAGGGNQLAIRHVSISLIATECVISRLV